MRFLKSLFFVSSFFFIVISNAQDKKGREALKFTKASLEDIVKQFGITIPDTSLVFKKYYLQVSTSYNQAKAEYEGYRGYMYDCIINNNSSTKIQKCLRGKNLDLKTSLASLQDYIKAAYFEEYLSQPEHPYIPPKDTNQNVGVITADFINSVVDTLTNAAIKFWQEAQKLRKSKKEELLKEIKSEEYSLSDFNTILKTLKSK